MKLPNGHKAVVAIEKLRDYCLNPRHPRGKHKARVLLSLLGLSAADAERLREMLLVAAQEDEAVPTNRDDYGQRYILDFSQPGTSGNVIIRSLWIVRQGEDFPRFTTCYVL